MWPLITEDVWFPERPSIGREGHKAVVRIIPTRREGEPNALRGATIVATCLGGFALRIRGKAVEPAQWGVYNGGCNRVVGVMAYLIAHRYQPIPRERLIDIFWEQVDGDRASQSLDRTISALRRVLEPSLQKYQQSAYIVGPRGGYRFADGVDIAVDAEEFISRYKQAVDVERLHGIASAAPLYHQAEMIYAGPFMDGVPYAELWCHHERQLLADYHRAALTKLAHYARLSRDFDRVTSYVHRILGEYGCQREVCRWLLDAYSEEGAAIAAQRHVEHCPYKQRLPNSSCPDPYKSTRE